MYTKANNFISNRTKNKEELTKGVNSTFITMIILIIFLFIYYLGIINTNATSGYSIRDLENQISQLKSQKNIMESKIANLKSLNNISKDDFSNTDMENIEKSDSLVFKESTKYVFNNTDAGNFKTTY